MLIRFAIMRQQLNRYIFGLLCAFCLMACSDGSEDDNGEDLPPYISDLVVLSLDADGRFATVKLDDGSTYDIRSQQLMSEVKDTLLRCLATYTLVQGKMQVYGMQRVFCSRPMWADSIRVSVNGEVHIGHQYLPRDPMNVVSLWKSGGYVNMHLTLMTTGKGIHQYAFCEDSVGHYSLLHSRPKDDAESYKEHIYLSMPIPNGVEHLTFSVHTYDSIYTRDF